MPLYFLKRYPFSLAVIVLVIYLSFFKPPSVDERLLFPGFDKVVHFCMYAGVSGMLWTEFFLNYRRGIAPKAHGFIGALICPIVMSGLIEIGQTTLTSYRGGDWFDFLANTFGVLSATIFSWLVIHPWLQKRTAQKDQFLKNKRL